MSQDLARLPPDARERMSRLIADLVYDNTLGSAERNLDTTGTNIGKKFYARIVNSLLNPDPRQTDNVNAEKRVSERIHKLIRYYTPKNASLSKDPPQFDVFDMNNEKLKGARDKQRREFKKRLLAGLREQVANTRRRIKNGTTLKPSLSAIKSYLDQKFKKEPSLVLFKDETINKRASVLRSERIARTKTMQLNNSYSSGSQTDKPNNQKAVQLKGNHRVPATILNLKQVQNKKNPYFAVQKAIDRGIPYDKEKETGLKTVIENQLDDPSQNIQTLILQKQQTPLRKVQSQQPTSLRQFLIHRGSVKKPIELQQNTLNLDPSNIKLLNQNSKLSFEEGISENSIKKTKEENLILLKEETHSLDRQSILKEDSLTHTRDPPLIRIPTGNKKNLEIDIDSKSHDGPARTATHFLSRSMMKGTYTPAVSTSYSKRATYRDEISDKIMTLSRSIDTSIDDTHYDEMLKTFSHSLNREFTTIFKRIEHTAKGNHQYSKLTQVGGLYWTQYEQTQKKKT